MITKLENLHPLSKTWIFQAENELTEEETVLCQEYMNAFLHSWTSHNQDLVTFGSVYHKRFLVFMADQTYAVASGCSQDKLMHFVSDLEKYFQNSFLGRTQVAYRNPGEAEIQVIPLDKLSIAYQSGDIHDDTRVFDNLSDTKEKFEAGWEKPLKDSWHKRFTR